MYMGHFAIALGARRWLQPLPMAWLLFASVEPDVHDAVGHAIPALSIGPNTHTIPGILVAALAIGLITAALFRQPSLALGAGLLVLSHLAVDYMTSQLPLWSGGPVVGLHLYAHPWADFLLETATVATGLCCYATSTDFQRPLRYGLLGMGSLMLAMQAVWNFGFGAG
jgi:hypothetical protein